MHKFSITYIHWNAHRKHIASSWNANSPRAMPTSSAMLREFDTVINTVIKLTIITNTCIIYYSYKLRVFLLFTKQTSLLSKITSYIVLIVSTRLPWTDWVCATIVLLQILCTTTLGHAHILRATRAKNATHRESGQKNSVTGFAMQTRRACARGHNQFSYPHSPNIKVAAR